MLGIHHPAPAGGGGAACPGKTCQATRWTFSLPLGPLTLPLAQQKGRVVRCLCKSSALCSLRNLVLIFGQATQGMSCNVGARCVGFCPHAAEPAYAAVLRGCVPSCGIENFVGLPQIDAALIKLSSPSSCGSVVQSTVSNQLGWKAGIGTLCARCCECSSNFVGILRYNWS